MGSTLAVEGGATRSESVRRGLARVPAEAEVIVVHDAARPLASPALFAAVIEAVTTGHADAAVPGLPVTDTVKVVDDARNVTGTLDRTTLVTVQTPQAFRAEVLRRRPTVKQPRPLTTPRWSRRWALPCGSSRARRDNLKITHS